MNTFTRKIRIIIPVVILGFIVMAGFRFAPDIRVEKILHQLELFRLKYTQQKVYLHTDKDVYIAGENIWLKGYVIDASSFMPDTVSKELYVDLIDYSNKQVHTEILRNRKGFAEGYLSLSDTLAEGNYQVRAYTNWMRNFDEGYFFSKTIRFKNPNYQNVITTRRLKSIKQFNKKLKNETERRTVGFYPEGGQLVAGLPSVIAFKAENNAGYSLNVSGIVKNSKGAEVAIFSSVHEGMGKFRLTPESNEKYVAEVKFDNGKVAKYTLPAIATDGSCIKADVFDSKKIKLTIYSNKPISNDDMANEFIIVGQSRGLAQYVSKVQWKGNPIEIEIPKDIFPTGIVQLTVFDGRSNPICERLVFIDHPNPFKIISKVRKAGNIPSDSLEMEFVVIDKDGNPVKGNFSLSVTEKLENQKVYDANILNCLFFTSDISGQVSNPGYYFDRTNPDALSHLDLLLLTQGWRRYNWIDLLANRLPPLRHSYSEGLTIGGLITRDFFRLPIDNSKVRLTVLSSYNDEYETTTDNHGFFNFPDLDYEDTITVKIEAFKPSGGKGVQIILTDTVIPGVKTPTLAMMRSESYARADIKKNNRKERIIFKKNYKGKPEPDISIPKIHSTPNDVIFVGDEASSYSNMFQYLQGRVPGVNVTGNKITIRGVNSFYASTDPLYLMDGIPIDAGSVGSLTPLDIAIIEILKGADAAIYGSRGANGVIAFYSKRGSFMKRGVIDFGMQGYQKRKEFYVAPYERFSFLTTENNVPRTVFWKPILKTDEAGKAFVKFKKSVPVENIQIVLEGMSDSGEILYYNESK